MQLTALLLMEVAEDTHPWRREARFLIEVRYLRQELDNYTESAPNGRFSPIISLSERSFPDIGQSINGRT